MEQLYKKQISSKKEHAENIMGNSVSRYQLCATGCNYIKEKIIKHDSVFI